MSQESGYMALGALIAVALVLLVLVVLGVVAVRGLASYFARFKGMQASRNARGEMTFGGVIDETPPPPRVVYLPDSALDGPEPEERQLQ